MATLHLYVKQHTQTGLKYFGVTVQDPYKYAKENAEKLENTIVNIVKNKRSSIL